MQTTAFSSSSFSFPFFFDFGQTFFLMFKKLGSQLQLQPYFIKQNQILKICQEVWPSSLCKYLF